VRVDSKLFPVWEKPMIFDHFISSHVETVQM